MDYDKLYYKVGFMESLHYLLMKSHAMLSRRILSEASRLGLTPGQPKVLEFLLRHGESDQKTIAAYCEIEPATVGSTLLRMEEGGLILRRQKAGNRRSLYVSLTEKGLDAANRMTDVFCSAETSAAEGLTAEETDRLRELLDKLCGTMQSQSEGKKKET